MGECESTCRYHMRRPGEGGAGLPPTRPGEGGAGLPPTRPGQDGAGLPPVSGVLN